MKGKWMKRDEIWRKTRLAGGSRSRFAVCEAPPKQLRPLGRERRWLCEPGRAPTALGACRLQAGASSATWLRAGFQAFLVGFHQLFARFGWIFMDFRGFSWISDWFEALLGAPGSGSSWRTGRRRSKKPARAVWKAQPQESRG